MLPKFIDSIAPAPLRTSRRGFLIGTAAVAGGLMVGYHLPGAARAETAGPANPLTGYVLVTPDNKVTVLSSQFDMGQGSYHGIASLVVEELGADWSQVDVIGASGNPKLYGNLTWGGVAQGTGGSSSMASSFDRYRQAGATARAMLVAAAAEQWQVPAAEIEVAGGTVTHASGKKASFGDFAARAAAMPVPADVALKTRDAWTTIGNEALRRYDSAAKANGTHSFTIDVRLPGMLTAMMFHPPKFGAKVKAFDGSAALKVRGVTDVVATDRGVAVVGEHMWAALKGREAVTVEWDESEAETRGSPEILAEYHKLVTGEPKATARMKCDAGAALASAAKVVEATYEFPYLAHAAMEPPNAVARMNADGTLEVRGGHQMPDLYQAIVAQTAGVKPEKVVMHVMKTGGGFGRRAIADADVVVESVMVAKAIGFRAPVKLQWAREDDMKVGRYRPAYFHRFSSGRASTATAG